MDLSQIDWKTILAPFVGGLAGYAGGHWGLHLGPEWQGPVTILLAGVLTALAHSLDVRSRSSNAVTLAPGISQAAAPPASTSSSSSSDQQSGRASIAPLFTLVALALAACTALGLATPQTFNEKLAVGYGAATSVLTVTDDLLKAGKLSANQARNIEAQDGNLKAALDIAAQAYTTNQTDGGNQLSTALTALNALSSYLAGIH